MLLRLALTVLAAWTLTRFAPPACWMAIWLGAAAAMAFTQFAAPAAGGRGR